MPSDRVIDGIGSDSSVGVTSSDNPGIVTIHIGSGGLPGWKLDGGTVSPYRSGVITTDRTVITGPMGPPGPMGPAGRVIDESKKYKDGDIITTLLPYDKEDLYDVPEDELPKVVGTISMKYNSIFDRPVTIVNGNGEPLENFRMVFLDLEEKK